MEKKSLLIRIWCSTQRFFSDELWTFICFFSFFILWQLPSLWFCHKNGFTFLLLFCIKNIFNNDQTESPKVKVWENNCKNPLWIFVKKRWINFGEIYIKTVNSLINYFEFCNYLRSLSKKVYEYNIKVLNNWTIYYITYF